MSTQLILRSTPALETLNQFFESRTSIQVERDPERARNECGLTKSEGTLLPVYQIVDPDDLRTQLEKNDTTVPDYHRVSCLEEVQEAELDDEPVIVRMGDYCRYVLHGTDASLRYQQLHEATGKHHAVLERPMAGSAHWLIGMVNDSVVNSCSVLDVTWHTDSFQFPVAISGPSTLDDGAQSQLRELVGKVLSALNYIDGPFRIECIRDSEKFAITEVDTGWFNQAMPADLLQLSGITDYWAEQCRALGIEVLDEPIVQRSVALEWLYSRSGIVESIAGVEATRNLPGVQAVQLNVSVGDTLGHVLDAASRDKLGYVVTTGDSVEVAKYNATRAVESIVIERRTIL